MVNFSSKEIDGHYNLIKMLLTEKKSTQRHLNLKRKLEKENIFFIDKKKVKMVSI